jgi:hypothetical protein
MSSSPILFRGTTGSRRFVVPCIIDIHKEGNANVVVADEPRTM